MSDVRFVDGPIAGKTHDIPGSVARWIKIPVITEKYSRDYAVWYSAYGLAIEMLREDGEHHRADTLLEDHPAPMLPSATYQVELDGAGYLAHVVETVGLEE